MHDAGAMVAHDGGDAVSTLGRFRCWRCGAECEEDIRVLPRTAACAACRADLHVCRQCQFYDLGVAKHCRETVADEVRDKERANFCAYLKVRIDAHAPADTRAADAGRDALAALFGDAAPTTGGSPSSAEAARGALEDLFGLNKK
jgi:hypothetical protein